MPIYERQEDDLSIIRWHATWRILASYVGTAYFWAWSCQNCRNW